MLRTLALVALLAPAVMAGGGPLFPEPSPRTPPQQLLLDDQPVVQSARPMSRPTAAAFQHYFSAAQQATQAQIQVHQDLHRRVQIMNQQMEKNAFHRPTSSYRPLLKHRVNKVFLGRGSDRAYWRRRFEALGY